ncbi:MAG: FAA hydrolase family protein [Acidimicrobiales bacterium]|nr:MAG: FAA hydrolase family protein [Acidimicrobiales bacterium]
MIFLTFVQDNELHLGVKGDAGIVDLTETARSRLGRALGIPRSPANLFALGLDADRRVEMLLAELDPSACLPRQEKQLQLGPPVPHPGKIVCVGRNYRKHAQEMDADVPTEPLLFSKYANAIAASGDAVDISGLEQVDYEAELAVVIGKRGKHIAETDSLAHVLGYANANDLSDRALQYRSSQFLIGKSLDGFLPLGPYLVTADEVGDPQDLPIRGWLNEELRQESHTSLMVFSVAEIVSYVSRFMTLEPGDLILTGTPEGVIKGRKDKAWLKPGDEYLVEVGPLGRLRTKFEARA